MLLDVVLIFPDDAFFGYNSHYEIIPPQTDCYLFTKV